MFTGIIKAVGAVADIAPKGGDWRLAIRSDGLPWGDYVVGESIAVSGVCLTAVELSADGFLTDVSRETLSVTTLEDLSVGSRVNLEPALALSERLGGHLVSGHVDCVGIVSGQRADARSLRLDIEVPADFLRYIARKGSVCLDGVSLTINTVSAAGFSVNIIPHTATATTISDYSVGTRVNIEVDLLMRYLERLAGADEPGGISMTTLRENGYG